MKHCNTCNTAKEHSEFHKRKASTDGLAARCKACQREYDGARSGDQDRAFARKEYAKTEAGREASKRAKKKYAENNKVKVAETSRKYIKNNPKKRSAHKVIEKMVRLKETQIQPCESCGNVTVAAHHDDYDQPRVVRWLCAKHHKQWHTENGEGKNAH